MHRRTRATQATAAHPVCLRFSYVSPTQSVGSVTFPEVSRPSPTSVARVLVKTEPPKMRPALRAGSIFGGFVTEEGLKTSERVADHTGACEGRQMGLSDLPKLRDLVLRPEIYLGLDFPVRFGVQFFKVLVSNCFRIVVNRIRNQCETKPE